MSKRTHMTASGSWVARQAATGQTYTVEGEYMGYSPEAVADNIWEDFSVNVPGPGGSLGGFDAVVILHRIPVADLPAVLDGIRQASGLMENVIEIRDDRTGEVVVDDWNDVDSFEKGLAGEPQPPKKVGALRAAAGVPGRPAEGTLSPRQAQADDEDEDEDEEKERRRKNRLQNEVRGGISSTSAPTGSCTCSGWTPTAGG